MHPGAVTKQERKKMLNKILDHMNDEKGHSEEERNKLEISGFIDNFSSVI